MRKTHLSLKWLLPALVLIIMVAPIAADGTSGYALCDVRVLYIFENPDLIDWPTLYYLNDYWGCRIDLLTLQPRRDYQHRLASVDNCELYLHEVYLDRHQAEHLDSIVQDLFSPRRPDLLIYSEVLSAAVYDSLRLRLAEVPSDPAAIFDIARVFEAVNAGDTSYSDQPVTLNTYELATRYKKRMALEIPQLLEGFALSDMPEHIRSRYRQTSGEPGPKTDFLTGLEPLRLLPLIEELFPSGPMKRTYVRHASKFISGFRASQTVTGQKRTDLILDAFRELLDLSQPAMIDGSDPRLVQFRTYLQRLIVRAERVALQAAGVAWDGAISLRDSPHGPKVKFTITVSVNGPREIVLERVAFHPHWDTTEVLLDTVVRTIPPHQTYVHEMLIDVDRQRLETEGGDSLAFSATLTYGRIPLKLQRSVPVRQVPRLKVAFTPGFRFVPPVGGLEVDRLVSAMALNLTVTKPRDYAGTAQLDLVTPRGVFAGAYRQQVDLGPGQVMASVRIPFTVSNLMDVGRQPAVVTLSVDGQVVAADTSTLRLARCHIADTLSVGFLPDSAGLLEDILGMTDVSHRALTDRSLMTADLSAYDVIILSPGCYRNHPSLTTVRDRLEEFMQWGGSLVVFGQDYDWPGGLLPFGLVPSAERIGNDDIDNLIPDAHILSGPYEIAMTNLLNAFHPPRELLAATVTPAEIVLQSPSGSALLSVSRLGSGQMIFCGLPLLDLIAELDLEAIHLLGNILNY